MTQADRPRFGALLALLLETYAEDVSEARATAYFEALYDLPVEAIEIAVRSHIRTSKWFPKPSELRDLYDPALGVADVLTRLRWFKMQHCLDRRYGSALLEIDQLVISGLGGMEVICNTLEAERERFLVDRYLPEWLETARVCGWELPPRDTLPTPAVRPLLEGPTEPSLRDVLRSVGRPMPSGGDQREKLLKEQAARLRKNGIG